MADEVRLSECDEGEEWRFELVEEEETAAKGGAKREAIVGGRADELRRRDRDQEV